MTKLKLGALSDEKPVKLTVELPAPVHHELIAYAKVMERETGQAIKDPAKLIAPMVERFMATDRGFAKLRRETQESAAQQQSGARPQMTGKV